MKKRILSFVMVAVMCLAMAVQTFATGSTESTGNVDVKGHIGTDGNPSVDPGPTDPENPTPNPNYDITYSTQIHWYVTQTSYPNVINGTSSGADETHRSKIHNNSAVDISVTLKSFVGDPVAESIASNLILTLTGDLATSAANTNLSGGLTAPETYTAKLPAATTGESSTTPGTWSYGFTGIYTSNTGGLTDVSLDPTYAMTLGFSF